MTKITDAQRKRLEDYAPSDIYTHNDGSPVAFMWYSDRVEVHRIMPDGVVRVVTRVFDEEEQWSHDIIMPDDNPTKPCDHCGVPIDSDIHTEELGMCLDCSNKYWTHDE